MLHARQRMRKQALWDESNRASNVRTLVFIRTMQGTPERQQKNSHTGQELTENVWKWAATSRKALNSIKNEKKYKPKSRKWQNLLRTSTAFKVKDRCYLIYFLPCFLVELILQALAKGRPLSCESQGVLRVAACGPSFMVVLRAPSVSACSRCWMLMDGVWWWCSTWCCPIFLLNGVWQGEHKSAEKDALLSLGLLWLTLACYKLVCFCGGCACYLSFRFVFGKKRGNSSEKVAKARRKTACIRADKGKMPQKMTATCHTRPQARLHKHKTANINERQQEHKEPGAKRLTHIVARTAGWRSSLSNGAGWYRHWVIEQWRSLEEAKTKEGEGRVQKPLFNNHSITAEESWHYPMCSCYFLLGVRQGHVGEENALWTARPKMWRHLGACELSFHKGALRAVSLALWQLWDGDGWSWSSTHCHFQRILLKGLCTEHAYESLPHGSPQAGLFLFALHVVLPFVVYFQELGN